MSLCEIETNDPKNPAYIDPTLVSCVKRYTYSGGVETCIHERGIHDPRCVTHTLTTTQVVALLEAHEAKQAEPSEREVKLIERLRRIADGNDILGYATPMRFAQKALQHAGVPVAAPEKETT